MPEHPLQGRTRSRLIPLRRDQAFDWFQVSPDDIVTILTVQPEKVDRVTTHSGCVWDYPEGVALVYADVRGHGLVLASVQDDEDACSAVLDEIGDCAECLRHMARFLAGMAASVCVAYAEMAGADRTGAIRQLESGLAAARAKLP